MNRRRDKLILFTLIFLIVLFFIIKTNFKIFVHDPPTTIHYDNFELLVNAKIEKLLNINKYKEDGYADYFYNKAFENYLFDAKKYLELAGKNSSNSYSFINKNTLEVVNGVPEEIKFIIAGSKKKKFQIEDFWKEEISQKNNSWYIFKAYSNSLFLIAEEKNNSIRNNDLSSILSALYCFSDHFQKNHPDNSYRLVALGNKKRLLKILISYYCKEDLIKFNELMTLYEDLLFYSEITSHDKYPSAIGINIFNNSFFYAIIKILFYDIAHMEEMIKLANYKAARCSQYNAIISLGIMKNLYWYPKEAYESHKALNKLKQSKDSLTKLMAMRASRISLVSFFRNSYTEKLFMNRKLIWDKIFPLVPPSANEK